MGREIYVFVARKADGVPMFMQHLDNALEEDPLTSLKRSLVQRLDSRPDVDHITLYKVTATGFELLSVERRDASNGFYPCYSCGQVTWKVLWSCDNCGRPACDEHRKPWPGQFTKKICLDCLAHL